MKNHMNLKLLHQEHKAAHTVAPTPRWRERLNLAARKNNLDIRGWRITRKRHIYGIYEQLFVDDEGLNEMYLDDADEELLLASLSGAGSVGSGSFARLSNASEIEQVF